MVAVYNQDLLSWYLITLKLRETVNNASKQIEASPEPVETGSSHHQQELQQLPSESLKLTMTHQAQKSPKG